MAYVNVKDWSVDQVTEWVKGLDDEVLPYTKSFLNNGVTGNQLLQFRADDLENLGVKIIGHQEIILQGVEHLRNFHYELEKENIQLFALRLSCAANSLFKELQHDENPSETVQTETMAGVHNIILTVKPLVCWLKRSPFKNETEYMEAQTQLLKLCVEMAFTAHRDKFSQTPVTTIRNNCEKLVYLADYIIQDVKDPLILQPASLDLTTLRKKEQELGLYIFPSYLAVHQIAEVKHGSPAHLSRKIEKGDEIVQVNYQTVVGWHREKVMLLLQDSSPEVLLTLKKRPQHTKVYGPIYMKPYRLPSKKRGTPYSRWNENLPSPRLLTINDLPQIPIPKPPAKTSLEELGTESSSDNDTDTPDSPLNEPAPSLFPLISRPVLQRRNTITGASPTSTKPYPGIEQFLKMYKPEALHSSSYHIQTNKFEDESSLLRDKSVSCSHGLELTQRPTTVIGISQNRLVNRQNSIRSAAQQDKPIVSNKKVMFEENNIFLKNYYNSNLMKDTKVAFFDAPKLNEEKSVSVNSLNSLSGGKESIDFIDEAEDLTDRSNMLTKEEEDSNEQITKSGEEQSKDKLFCSELKDVHVHNIIKKFDEKLTMQENVIVATVRTKIQNKIAMDVVNIENAQCRSENPLNEQNSNETEPTSPTKVAQDEFENIETPDGIKYELGIPIIETRNTFIVAPPKEADIVMDVPPKPPPRTNYLDSFKPKYPSDSPKPYIDTLKRQQSHLMDNLPPPTSNQLKPEIIVQKPPLNIPSEALPSMSSTSYHKSVTESAKSDVIMEHNPDLVLHTPPQQRYKGDSGRSASISLGGGKMIRSEHELDTHKITTSTPRSLTMSKVSPTNSIVRAMMYSNKNKNGKKKNTLTAKKRKVSVNDVSPGDMEGFLYKRFRTKDGQKAYWDKLWFVLIANRLYGFNSKDALKADVLIYLTGFTASHATEVKSRSNAFKVYHTGTVFYFSAETYELTLAWIEYITAATLHPDAKPNENILYSQTDESDTEKPTTPTEKTNEGIKKFGSLKKFGSKKSSDPSSHSGSTSLDRKWFFNKSTSSKNSVPVPTAQFRSYRKISATQIESVSTGNFTSHIPNFANRLDIQNFSSSQNISVPNLSIDLPKPEKNPGGSSANTLTSRNRLNNFSHASNPSLYNVNDFHPFFAKAQHQTRENLAGFVTLEELMNRQSEEQTLNPLRNNEVVNIDLIKPDVVYGEVPVRPKGKPVEKKRSFKSTTGVSSETKKVDSESGSFCFGKKSGRKNDDQNESCNVATYPKSKQHDLKHNNRSLPRAHKLLETYDAYNSSKQYPDSCKSLTNFEDSQTVIEDGYGEVRIIRRESMEKLNRIEVTNSNVKLKSAMQYTPLALPLVDDKAKMNPKLAFELNLDEKSHKSGKLMSFFHKQSDSRKDKHSVGSPNLHRSIFRKGSTSEDDWKHHNQTQNQTHHSISSNQQHHDKDDLANSANRVIQHVDYPGLEYPPVFEPETYSLSDPQSSLTILRKQGK